MRFMLGFVLSLLISGICQAEIVTVAVHTANLRSSPSTESTYVVLEAPRYYPLSVQSERNSFYEVRDFQGIVGWIHQSLVSDTKGVVVEVKRANVRQGPGRAYPVVFHAYKGVTFKVRDEKEGWLQITHENGKSGWIYKPLTWGQ